MDEEVRNQITDYCYKLASCDDVEGLIETYSHEASKVSDRLRRYCEYFSNSAIDDEQEFMGFYHKCVEQGDMESENMSDEQVATIWDSLKNIIMKESDYEKRLYAFLKELAADHPVISGVIIAFLTVVLLGLLEDCLHDAWQEAQNTGNGNKVYMYIDDSYHIINTDDAGAGLDRALEKDKTTSPDEHGSSPHTP